MALDSLFETLRTNYHSREDNIVDEIYKPCFKEATMYYRGTGYFRSTVLDLYRTDVREFCIRNPTNKMSILTSTEVMPADAEDILTGYSLRDLERSLEMLLFDEHTKTAAEFMCALIASGHLDIHVIKGPLYHDKVGFFSDNEHNVVAFTGSGNETLHGVSENKNFERYVVSWNEHISYPDYGKIWHSDLVQAIDEGVYFDSRVYRFDELSDYFLARHNINKEIGDIKFQDSIKLNYFNYDLLSPAGPQNHQIKAFNGWKRNKQRALLEHATGTYKTATGLLCADYFLKNQNTVVISTPLKMVSENWAKLIRKCFSPIVRVIECWSDHGKWSEEALSHIMKDEKTILVFVNKSLWGETGRDLVKILKGNYLLIADEAHNWEAIDASQFIEENQPISRLALSARLSEPNKEHDLDHVLQFFSYGLHQYTDSLPLPKAIEMGFLREYEYKIMPIVPDDKWIGAKPTSKNARIIWREFSETKKDISPDIAIRALNSKSRVLVYTGPKVDDASMTMKSMQKIWNSEQNLPMTIKKITGQESPTQRYNIINDFTLGLTQSLVAIKVLDEGVDLPVSDAAIMCKSNASYRQWIQRRGRILRKKVVSDNSQALVVDLVLDMQSLGEDLRQRIRELYTYEVKRTLEFADSSLTGPGDILDQLKLWGWIT